uniref:Uncharacterized protein n=1 Tax=Odontella aurita TaxID=265563 RepID=A0A7S4HM04_9STRA|mmetsp:Transcript_12171/g.35635  ORF Transcript_12171/g.35635 Transcript_12171/m.35635 type:complete len:290 (+) Transcript_12171:292-1161(+)
MGDQDEQQRYEEALQREYVKLKVELAQVQSDTERRKLMSTQLSSETDQLRSAIAQSQNAEREMRDLAKQLADEVSKLQREVKSKEEDRDQVKAEAERTQEQRAQLEKTLEVLGGRKVTELLNSRRTNSQGGCYENGDSPAGVIDVSNAGDGVLTSRRNLIGSDAPGSEQSRVESAVVDIEGQPSIVTTRSASSAMSVRNIGHSVRTFGLERGEAGPGDGPFQSEPESFLSEKRQEVPEVDNSTSREKGEQVSEQNHYSTTASTSGRTSASTDSLRMSVRGFMKGLDKEC